MTNKPMAYGESKNCSMDIFVDLTSVSDAVEVMQVGVFIVTSRPALPTDDNIAKCQLL